MTIIDQRILIPAGPEVVWEQISDIANNPKWQADCRSVSFLTSVREGPGLRWRSTNAAGRETVLEITTWYDRIGYEYTFVDGVPFRESKGRFRLQEIAEGTIVQWTFTYEMGGLLGGVRNSLNIKRQIENNMIDSLKTLWRHVNQSGGSQPFHEAKSLLRESLDYEERSKYRPRHPSALTDRKELPEKNQPIPEPPIADDDTRPRPAVAILTDPAPVIEEPEFVSDVPHADEAWMPKPAGEKPHETQERTVVESAPESVTPPVVNFDESPAKSDTQPNTPVIDDAPKPPPTPADVDLMQPLKDISKLDTAQISIWEVFGVPRPSETQEIQPLKTETLSSPVTPPVEAAAESTVEENPAPVIEIEPVAEPQEAVIVEVALAPPPEAVVATPVVPTTRLTAETQIVGLRFVIRRKLVRLRRAR